MIKFNFAAWFLFFLSISCPIAGATTPKIVKISGKFLVADLIKNSETDFEVVFKNLDLKSTVKSLIIKSNYLHPAVSSDKILDLSAEIYAERNGIAQARQILIMTQGQSAKNPIWWLSNRFPDVSLRGSRYLEMHAPSADYLIL